MKRYISPLSYLFFMVNRDAWVPIWKVDDRKKRRYMMKIVPEFVKILHLYKRVKDHFNFISIRGYSDITVEFYMGSGYVTFHNGFVERHEFEFGDVIKPKDLEGFPAVHKGVTYYDIRIRDFSSGWYFSISERVIAGNKKVNVSRFSVIGCKTELRVRVSKKYVTKCRTIARGVLLWPSDLYNFLYDNFDRYIAGETLRIREFLSVVYGQRCLLPEVSSKLWKIIYEKNGGIKNIMSDDIKGNVERINKILENARHSEDEELRKAVSILDDAKAHDNRVLFHSEVHKSYIKYGWHKKGDPKVFNQIIAEIHLRNFRIKKPFFKKNVYPLFHL